MTGSTSTSVCPVECRQCMPVNLLPASRADARNRQVDPAFVTCRDSSVFGCTPYVHDLVSGLQFFRSFWQRMGRPAGMPEVGIH